MQVNAAGTFLRPQSKANHPARSDCNSRSRDVSVNGVFSDDTALFLHGMTDRAPFSLVMTFPRSYNATGARKAGITCRTCANGVLDLGLRELKTPNGNMVRAYDLERTLCDIVRGQKVVDAQLVTPAMQAYARKPDRDPAKLMRYAKVLGVERKMRTYLEILL